MRASASTPTTIALGEEPAGNEEQRQEARRPYELEMDEVVRPDEESGSSSEVPLLHGARNYGSSSLPLFPPDDEELELSGPHGSGTWFIWALAVSAGISGLLFGYDTAVISSTLVSIGSDLSRELTTLDKSLVTSCTSLFALVGSSLSGVLGDKLGRKPVIMVADALFILGALWQCVTSTVWGMIVGRSVVGLAVGMASLVTPLYISELSPSALRGRMVTILTLFITGGQVVAYTSGWLFSELPSGWRWMVGLGAVPAIIQLLVLLFLPETPRWLVRAGRMHTARKILRRVYGKAENSTPMVEQILRRIQSDIHDTEDEEARQKPASTVTSSRLLQRWKSLFQIGCNRRALAISCMLQGLQQGSGINIIMYFSATIFSLLSFSSPTLTALSVAVTNFLFTFVAFALIDRIGRRRILLCTVPIMSLALFLCAAAFSTLDLTRSPDSGANGTVGNTTTTNGFAPLLIVVALTIYTASYASGIGTIPWQQSELFPLSVRALGSGLATATNWASNFVIGLTFLPLMEWVSPGWTFVMYAVVCVVGWVMIWMIYPEMSGLGLEDVRGLLAESWGVEESLRGFEMRKERKRRT